MTLDVPNRPVPNFTREVHSMSDNHPLKRREFLRRSAACAACGSCLSHCPQALPIPDKLAAVHALLGRP